jgi:protein-disulfide isomerase
VQEKQARSLRRSASRQTGVVREQLAKEARRKRTIWTTAIAVAVLLIAGVAGWGIYASQRSSSYNTPANASADADGLVVGSGDATVDVYLDFMCPHCKAFDDAAGSTLGQLVADKKIKLVYHPVAFLDAASTTDYSTRSSASAACAADGGKVTEYVRALYARQPAEGGPGLSDDELVQAGGSVGLIDPAFAHCVRDGDYSSWTEHVTDAASERGVTGTPTVLVNGTQVEASAAAITSAVEAAGA